MNNPPKYLYHYCDVNTFFNIVSSKEIWLSSIFEMNDLLETHWIDIILNDILKESASNFSHNFLQLTF